MTISQIKAQTAGILARTKQLVADKVPFDDYRVMQTLDAAFLLSREGVSDWEATYNAVLDAYGQRHAAAH